MRNVLFLLIATSMAGCLCGGYDGGGDRVYQRNGAEMLILCENGGFVASLETNMLEGRSDGATATLGETGELAFDLQYNADGTMTTPQLGTAAWTAMDLDQVALDHANVMCNDLTTRSWWAQ